MSVRFRTKWLRVRIPLLSLNLFYRFLTMISLNKQLSQWNIKISILVISGQKSQTDSKQKLSAFSKFWTMKNCKKKLFQSKYQPPLKRQKFEKYSWNYWDNFSEAVVSWRSTVFLAWKYSQYEEQSTWIGIPFLVKLLVQLFHIAHKVKLFMKH